MVLGLWSLSAILHPSNEPGKLPQWLCHDDNTINIVVLTLIITINFNLYLSLGQLSVSLLLSVLHIVVICVTVDV